MGYAIYPVLRTQFGFSFKIPHKWQQHNRRRHHHGLYYIILFKSRRRAVAAVCPESLPQAHWGYLEGLCLRLFVCAGVGGQVAEHGFHGSDGYARIYRYIIAFNNKVYMIILRLFLIQSIR